MSPRLSGEAAIIGERVVDALGDLEDDDVAVPGREFGQHLDVVAWDAVVGSGILGASDRLRCWVFDGLSDPARLR